MAFFKFTRAAFFCSFLLLCTQAWASPLADSSAFIPLKNVRAEATDLIHQGQRLLPQQAAALRDQGYDISAIDPDPTTSVWSPTPRAPIDDESAFPINEGDTVQFYRIQTSPGNIFRFTVRHRARDGVTRLYTVFLARRTQTYLLRRNLLRKLGYVLPPMKHLHRLDVEFSSSLAKKNDFLDNTEQGLSRSLLGDKEWVLNLKDENSKIAQLQDVVIFQSQEFPVNLSMGFIRADINQGRRLINALLIPYNLVDVKESVNGFRWHSAQLRSNGIYTPLAEQEGFTTSLADARWVMRRILQLTRKDWEDVVGHDTGYPVAAQKLLVEKLISRRNEMRRLLQMDGADLAFNPMISYGQDLQNGELLKGEWNGIAAKLANEEEPSLLSGGEMVALFKSKFISSTIAELVRRANQDLIPRTNLAKKAMEAHQKRFFKDLEHFIKTGEERKAGMGIWKAPYLNADLILSREVVAGSYLGTDNRVQLADTFGVSLATGMHVGTTGLNPNIQLAAGTQVHYNRIFAHLKPLTSVKTALDQPYDNMIVPLLKREWAGLIDPSAFTAKEGESKEDYAKRLRSVMQSLKGQLGNGESLIVTDSIGAALNLQAGYSFAQRVQAQASFGGSQMVLSRLHILRVDDTLHVYKDFGNMQSLHFTVRLRAAVEVLGFRAKFSKGTARTDFFRVDLTDDLEQNPNLPLALSSIREILLENRVRGLRLFAKPHRLRHKLQESQSNFNFLFWNRFSLKNQDVVTILREHEEVEETYVRRLIGSRSGNDFQTFAIDIVNELISEVANEEISVKNTTSGDPGDTLFGKSKARYAYFEGEKKGNSYSEMFVGVVYRWKGWSANRNQLEKIVRQFSERYNFQFFHPQAFQQIRRAELYNLNFRVLVYDHGIRYALGLVPGQFRTLLDEHSVRPDSQYHSRHEKAIRAFAWLKRRWESYSKKGDLEKMGDVAVRLISLLESNLDYEGFRRAVGGQRNFMIQPILNGFLQGEDGKMAELPIEGAQLGEPGSQRVYGPLTTTQFELGMIESEFFVYWLLRRI